MSKANEAGACTGLARSCTDEAIRLITIERHQQAFIRSLDRIHHIITSA